MKINAVLCSMMLLAVHACCAQDSAAKKQRTYDHFIGVQLNELVRQVISDDITKNAKQNPYLLTYAGNSKRSGFGIRAGVGVVSHNIQKTDVSGFGLDTVSKLFSVQLRCGVVWSENVYKNFVAGFGLDIVGNFHEQSMKVTGVKTGSFILQTGTHIKTIGCGPVVSLRYDFTRRIALGTEASFYYITGSSKMFNLTSNGKPANRNTESKISNGTLNLPVVLYFTVRI